MVSSAGGKKGFVYPDRQDTYRALRREGSSKEKAARISNEGHTTAGRKSMAKKASVTRKLK
jgi:hypothetical protein